MPYKRKTNLSARPMVTRGTIEQPVDVTATSLTSTDKIADLLKDLPPSTRTIVMEETEKFYSARLTAGTSYLAMGEHLFNLREILEPKQVWKQFINLLPNMTQATAYRMIWAWENAQRVLPSATLQIAVAQGHKLISNVKDQGFSKGYAKAVDAVVEKLGPAPKEDAAKAQAWLGEVVAQKKLLAKSGGAGVRFNLTPNATTGELTMKRLREIEESTVRGFVRMAKLVPEDKREEFALKSIGMIADLLGLPAYKMKPVAVPKEIKEHLGPQLVRVVAA